MHDSELKKFLVDTCPILPGQEARAWNLLCERLRDHTRAPSPCRWLVYPTWRGALLGATALFAAALLGDSAFSNLLPVSFASANSETPGIYATSFYSHSAQAQVVWLNGLPPASDQPTYLDPTTPVPRATSKNSRSSGKPDSL